MAETIQAATAAHETSLKALTDQAKAAMDRSDFVVAKAMLLGLHQMVPTKNDITQMLALATYKSKQPTARGRAGGSAQLSGNARSRRQP